MRCFSQRNCIQQLDLRNAGDRQPLSRHVIFAGAEDRETYTPTGPVLSRTAAGIVAVELAAVRRGLLLSGHQRWNRPYPGGSGRSDVSKGSSKFIGSNRCKFSPGPKRPKLKQELNTKILPLPVLTTPTGLSG